jgi:hypothetical protein
MGFQKLNFQCIFLILICMVAMISIGWFLQKKVYDCPYEPVHFSFTKLPEVRKKIADLVMQKYSPNTVVTLADVGIFVKDLNDDGIDEYIVLVTANGFTAVGGIHTAIYTQKNGKPTLLWDRSLTFGKLAILHHKTNGYHDIWSFVLGHTEKSADRKHVLIWTKNGYDYGQSEYVTDQERQELMNEKL